MNKSWNSSPHGSVRILCAGDIHMGRRPIYLPDGAEGQRFSATAVWEEIVRLAVRQGVDLVALTGDIVDRENRFFEAFGPLEKGLADLASAGIDTVAVAGNHDFDVFPRLIESARPQRFHLLGKGGRWERKTIEKASQAILHVDGWSFPSEHVRINPLDAYNLPGDPTLPIIGVLHADLDQRESTYGPISLAQLQSKSVSIWLLGHIHKPALFEKPGSPPVLYPGSPLPLDPGETGKHGPWLIEINHTGCAVAQQNPIARIRYDSIEVNLTGVEGKDEMEGRVASALSGNLKKIANESGPPEYVCYRLRLVGRTRLHRQLEGLLESHLQEFQPSSGELKGFVEKIDFETRPDLDLAEIARGSTIISDLAMVLQSFEGGKGTSDYSSLVQIARQKLKDIHNLRQYLHLQEVGSGGPGEEAAVQTLHKAGMLLLDSLIGQREGGQ